CVYTVDGNSVIDQPPEAWRPAPLCAVFGGGGEGLRHAHDIAYGDVRFVAGNRLTTCTQQNHSEAQDDPARHPSLHVGRRPRLANRERRPSRAMPLTHLELGKRRERRNLRTAVSDCLAE